MPIYAYRCTTCGHAKDVLQKMSDPVLVQCPECGASTFAKQVTAAGFQLKGSGWYVTDFRGGNNKPAADKADAKADGASADSAQGDAGKSAPAKGDAAAATEKPASAKSDAAPAPAPAAAPATPVPGSK